LKVYLYDIKGEKAAGSAPAAAAKAKGHSTPGEVGFHVLKVASPEAHFRMMLINAANHDSELVDQAIHTTLGAGAEQLTHADMKKLQRPLYSMLYGQSPPKTGT
jgi:hypothetical protein